MLSCKKRIQWFLLMILIGLFVPGANAQEHEKLKISSDSNTHSNNKKLKFLIAGNSIAYTGVTAGLYSSWYKDYPFENFHFVNDNKKWLQVDKAGHAWSSYMQGRVNMALWKQTGIENRKAVWIGGLTGFAYMNVIEVLDGFSSRWGFSWGDYIADIAGSGLLITQELLWKEQRVLYKFSYREKNYREKHLKERAYEIYGEHFPERLLNDYNAQTYWLSFNLQSFLKETKIPGWLSLAIGYGGDGMFGELNNKWTNVGGVEYDCTGIKRYRQFYISPDIDFSKIKTKSKWLKRGFFLLSCIKFPAPSIEYSNRKTRFHWLGF